MKKILISWLAYNNDFIEDGKKVSPESPNLSVHKNYFDYDEHILLYAQEKDFPRMKKLISYLNEKFPDHKITIKFMDIIDIVDVMEIKPKIDTLISENRKNKIDIFFSPGTSAMQVAWYLVGMEGTTNLRIFQGRPVKYTKSGKPEFPDITFEKSAVPVSVLIKEAKLIEYKEEYKISNSIKKIFENAEKISVNDKTTTLIRGESGTGKEYLARFIHDNSIRRSKAFIAVNCASIPDQLLESELFGHKKGAFTGATEDKEGIFRTAEGGTVFLDEIGDITPYMQKSLLRVMQESEIRPIGCAKTIKVNVRVITATNKNLEQLCNENKFRWDLYYRLAVTELELPSLIERGREEIKEMIEFLSNKKARMYGREKPLKINKEAMNILLEYSYPGNIRELENIIENFYIFCKEEVTVKDISKRLYQTRSPKSLKWEDIEKNHIEYALKLLNYNQNQTRKAIGYGSINTLKKKIEKYRIRLS